MKTSRSLLHGYNKSFGLIILFTMGTVWGTDMPTVKPVTTVHLLVPVKTTSVPHIAIAEQKEDVQITHDPEEHSDVPLASPTVPKLPTESPSSIPSSKDTTLEPKLHPKQALAVTTLLTSHPEKKATSTTVSPHSEPEGTSATQRIPEDISDMSTLPDQVTPHIHGHVTVGEKYPAAIGKNSSETTGTVSTALRVTSGPEPSEKTTQTKEETEMTTTPSQNILDTITTGAADEKPEPDSAGANSSGNNYIIIIVAVAFCLLCLLAIIAFLYHRRRYRSGSTSFNTAEWAGQVALPDDSGLDRDIEPGSVTVSGDGETRRNTLVTFFGKRQSRVPSVAMEDISGKREREECQQLLDGDASIGSGPEGSEEANGKLPEPTMQSSEETSTPNKPEGSSS
ncbi:leukosialin [Sceloporus undulatus]|uniref:leukosialin n=1 Tax=Sceloporus undulatus TaxID=8520 RepID=UPI001C4BA10C|nr:leukosialin [Sceloporus undulatus]XP_042327604.1 leukosialin [Sceloporus undulatus]